jgi:HAD superfamily hydrolase (TIGR01509 family)
VIQAVIFDIDGTLVDSVDLHAAAWQDAFAHYGVEVPFDAVRKQIGKGGDQLIPVFLSREQLDAFGADLDDYRGKLFKSKYLAKVRAFPASRELIARVRDTGKRVALASSAKPDEIQVYKKIADIEDLIETETSADDAEASKPAPDIFEAALQRLGEIDPDRVLVVGDTPYDAQAAGRAGLRTIGVRSGGFPEDELRAAGCIAIYQDPADLVAHFDESPLAS